MSRIFKRPMFRKGGNVGEGIMTGIVDREQYGLGTEDITSNAGFGNFGQGTRSAEELGYDFNFAVPTFKRGKNQSLEDLQKQYSTSLLDAAGDRDSFDPLTKFLLTYGPAAVTQTGGGGTIGNLLAAGKEPIANLIKDRESEDSFKRDIRLKSAGAAIDTKKEQDEQAMEIENKLETLKSDVINKGKELQNKIYANKELTDAERDNLITKLGNDRRIAIEKIDSQYANELKLRKFDLENSGGELLKAAKAEIFSDEIKTYPGRVDVAQAATNFKTSESSEAYKKLGSMLGEVLTFDISDEKLRKQNKALLKKLRGKIVYDPFSRKYHKITKDGYSTYKDLASIPIDEDTDTDTDNNNKNKEGPLMDFEPENEFSAFPGTIKGQENKKKRYEDQADRMSNISDISIGDI